MIEKDKLVEIGKFQKTHALRGELNAVIDVPLEYVDDENPLIVEMEGIPVPFYAESVREKGSTTCLIKLRGVDSQQEAAEMVNKSIFAPRDIVEDYMECDGEMLLEQDILGFKVLDVKFGDLGEVARVDSSTDNVLLVVEGLDGGEYLIPFVDDFILKINVDNKTIETSVPDGLLDMNVSKDDL